MPLVKLLPYYDVKRDFGAVGDGVTDDTVAIQAALDQCAADDGGTIYFPPGTYLCNGSFQTATGATSEKYILRIPARNGTSSQKPCTIRLTGLAPALSVVWGSTSLVTPAMAIIKTTNADSGGDGSAAIIASPGPDDSVLNIGPNFNAVTVVIDGLAFQTPDNPQVTAINLQHAACCIVRDVTVWGGGPGSALTQPTHVNARGLVLPVTNNAAQVRVDNYTCIGMYTGLVDGEHAYVSQASIGICNTAVLFPGNTHASHYARLLTQSCLTHLKFTTADSTLFIGQHDVEWDANAGWWSVGNVIEDASNHGHGIINYASFYGTAAYPKNGGSHLVFTNLKA